MYKSFPSEKNTNMLWRVVKWRNIYTPADDNVNPVRQWYPTGIARIFGQYWECKKSTDLIGIKLVNFNFIIYLFIYLRIYVMISTS